MPSWPGRQKLGSSSHGRSGPAGPPKILPILDNLLAYEVDFIVVGSAATVLYGVSTDPGDLDIVPEVSGSNLERLAKALADLDARPTGNPGHWEGSEDDFRWVADPVTEEWTDSRTHWYADPNDLSTLDVSFATRFGNLDVVPNVAGAYLRLAKKALQVDFHGRSITVAHVDDLLATLTVPRRPKDAQRVIALRKLQREL